MKFLITFAVIPLLLCCKEENAIQKTQLLTNNEIIDTSFQVKVPI